MKTLVINLLLTLQVMGYSFFQSEASINANHLKLIHAIKDTVITTQKTRGLTNNYMNGNVVAQLLVYGQRGQMSKNFQSIDEGFTTLELTPGLSKSALALMQTSKHLNKKAFKEDSAEVFSSYSHIIQKWIDLNENVINERFKQGDAKIYKELLLLNNVLLPLTENIGKMRGLGSGIVARGYCKEKEESQMKSFVNEIKRYKTLLEYHMKQTHYDALGSAENRRINQHIRDYTELTETKVISQSDINLVTNEYFDQGTGAISEVLKIYNVVSSSLQE